MTGGVWIASYVLLWVAVVLLGFAVVVLLRQIGVLHARLRPMGVHFAGEGLPIGATAPPAGVRFADADLTLLTFTSPTCTVCASLLPSLGALAGQYDDVAVEVLSHAPDTLELFRAYHVSSTPYVVAVDAGGTVRGGGVANSLEQIEVLLASARAEVAADTTAASPGADR